MNDDSGEGRLTGDEALDDLVATRSASILPTARAHLELNLVVDGHLGGWKSGGEALPPSRR